MTLSKVSERVQKWFPEREIVLRSDSNFRRFKLSPRKQMAGLAAAVLITGSGLASVTGAALLFSQAQDNRREIAAEAAHIAKAEQRMGEVEHSLQESAQEIQRRVEFMERLLPMLPQEFTDSAEELSASSTAATKLQPAKGEGAMQADPTLTRLSALYPQAAQLLKLEQRQLAMTAHLTAFANQRADKAESMIRKLGLNPRPMLATAQDAMGGPLEELATGADGKIDPRLERLGDSLARMEALERGLASLPQVMPVNMANVSSGFGYRRDPFVGRSAMHSGLDFRGRSGDPIRAASGGTVVFVGTKSGYGKTVEISHGNGVLTRYAHMSAFQARKGQTVGAGDIIGAIGNTGRSTGPHLHFEVRIHDRAVNPRPFLEAAPDVVQQARTHSRRGFQPNA